MTDDHEHFRRHIHELEAFGHRGSATDREHQAADYLVEELKSIGLEAGKEHFHGSRSSAARMLVHVLLAAFALAFLLRVPILALVLTAIALFSFVAEQMTRGIWLSRPFCRAISHNVIGRAPAANAPRRRLVVSAHYDTQKAGWIWAISRFLNSHARLPLLLQPPMFFVGVLMIAQLLLAATLLAFPALPSARGIAIPLLGSYLLLAIFLAQWAASGYVPGIADNASGVAAVLEIARAWRADPPAQDVEILFLLTGCEESILLGAAAWADLHRRELDALPTVFVNIDGIGFGPPRFLGAEVPAVGIPLRVPAWLIDACRDVARDLKLADAGPHSLPGPTDTLAFLARGRAAVSIVGFQDGYRLPHYHTMNDTSENMSFDSAHAGTRFAQALVWKLATRAPPGMTNGQ